MAELMKENEVSFYIGDRHIAPYGTGGGSVDITEITAENLEDAVAATTSVTIKIGRAIEDATIYDYNTYYLFYALINSSLVAIPIVYLDAFVKKGKPIYAVRRWYKSRSGWKEDNIIHWRNYWEGVYSFIDDSDHLIDDVNLYEYIYIDSETVSVSLKIDNLYSANSYNEDFGGQTYDESKIGSYRIVSDEAGFVTCLNNGYIGPWLHSYYKPAQNYSNGLVGIECGVPELVLKEKSTNIQYSAISNLSYLEFEGYEPRNQISLSEYQGSIGAVYNSLNYGSNVDYYDNNYITKDKIPDYIEVFKNRLVMDSWYNVTYTDTPVYINFMYNYWSGVTTDDSNWYLVDYSNNHIPVNVLQDVYYFDYNYNSTPYTGFILFVNPNNETFENGELKWIPFIYTKNNAVS